VRHFDNWKESLSLFSEFNPGDVILVKASRAEGLEELASAIKTSVMIEAEGESI
jgi:UDP-N-acetylmuramyl pentapeptide synthase